MTPRLLLTIVLCVALCRDAVAQSSTRDSRVALPETVELALVVAALTPLGLDTGNSIDRTTAYFAAVEDHFATHRDHPAVLGLGADFSLPRLVGNAADFAFTETGDLVRVDSSGSLWGDIDGDLFAHHQVALADFARVTDFRTFFVAQRATYNALRSATESAASPANQRRWLEKHFPARPGPSTVFVSPLMAGHHWTTIIKPEPRIWLSGPRRAELPSPETRLRYARKLFTEISHQYVNPLTDSLQPAVSAVMRDDAVWRAPDARGYTESALRFNEYMTWAAFLMYASELADGEAFRSLAQEVTGFMVERRGFISFAPFAAEALARYQGGLSGAEVQRLMVDWAKGYAAGSTR